ncbi:Crp/Fnr family transcriptional regulator [Nonlabens mediterrranea]|uniref:Crp/Fnr family transcriptional regulator n=1 Tax=Nonlabens mediterrranea TaxID=1419947 RepID=A0ABS0A9P7_9FLAO|nr:Crp/Fnr family transcriptional regulator [Nonlabens mediterrranea]
MELPAFLYELTEDENTPSLEYAQEVFNLLEVRKVRKKETILYLGDTATKIYFVKKGILKCSIMDDSGNLHTTRFVADNDAVTSMVSYIEQQPSNIQIDCVEDAEILCFKYEDFQYMSKLYPGLAAAFHKIMLRRYHGLLDEKARMISRDATSRYLKFIELYPAIVDRLPLKEIASFLGIRQQSLSRLRSKIEN